MLIMAIRFAILSSSKICSSPMLTSTNQHKSGDPAFTQPQLKMSSQVFE